MDDSGKYVAAIEAAEWGLGRELQNNQVAGAAFVKFRCRTAGSYAVIGRYKN